MSIHSDLLVTWTLKDTEEPTTAKYIDRLIDLYQQGLYMNKGSEILVGHSGDTIKSEHCRVCLTEIRLTKVETHAQRYGRLGIGFKRDFIISRGGNPVLYIPNGNSPIIDNLIKLRNQIGDGPVEKGNIIEDQLLLFNSIMPFAKNMNDVGSEKMEYYDEMEWRIIHYDHLEKAEFQTRISNELFRIPFDPKDVNLLVFPNLEVMTSALNNKILKEYFNIHCPMMVKLEECSNF